VIRKKVFYYLEQIATAEPRQGFADLYKDSIHESFADMDKDDLIRRLIWLQLKDSIGDYEDSDDLNAGYENKNRRSQNGSVRLFINLGGKDGLNPEKLVRFIADSTDVDQHIIDRVTVKDLSSFFNVPETAAEFIVEQLTKQKYKGRSVRLEQADQGPRDRGGYEGGKGRGHDDRGGRGRGGDDRRDRDRGGDRDRSSSHFNREGAKRFSDNARAGSFADGGRVRKRSK
jgi:ATP-dependent RNA helicase DeaD